MISAILLFSMATAQQAEPAPVDSPSQQAESVQVDHLAVLRVACENSSKLKSYSFQFESDAGSPFGRGGSSRGGGGRGGEARGSGRSQEGGVGGQAGRDAKPEPPKPWVVTWQNGQPTLFQQGEFHAARLDDVTIYRVGEGKWRRLDMSSGGFGRGRGQDGERPERPEGMMQAFQMRSISLPHDLLSQLASAIDGEQLTQSTKLGLRVFEGPLTDEGAAKLINSGRSSGRGDRGGFGGRGGGGDRPEMKTSGSFTLVLDASGVVRQLKVETSMSGTFGDREFERKSKKMYKLSKQGESKVELGEKARAMLKPKKTEGEEF